MGTSYDCLSHLKEELNNLAPDSDILYFRKFKKLFNWMRNTYRR